jgi:rhodanese-related sulfurtransferase
MTNLLRVTVLGMPVLLAAGVACDRTPGEANRVSNPAAAESSLRLVNTDEAQLLIASKKVAILDVRTMEEFRAGHIAGATNLNLHDPAFEGELRKLDRSQPYLVHCAVGGRSARASATMKRLGFTTLYDLAGGMKAWEEAGKPIAR